MFFTGIHLYLDDVEVGPQWQSLGRTITETDIGNFAGLSGDFNPIHIDHEFARGTPFRRPIAHGFAVFSIASGLGVMSPPVRTVAMLRVRYWNFQLPVFAGDTVRVRSRVVEKTPRGRGKRGEVVWYRGVVNQDGKVVQEGEIVTLLECRPLPKVAAAVGAEAELPPVPSPNRSEE